MSTVALAHIEAVFPELSTLPEDQRVVFLRRFQFYWMWHETPRAKRAGVVRMAAIQMKMSRRTVHEIFTEAEATQSYRRFLPAPRSDRGTTRAWEPHVIEFLRAAYLRTKSKQRAWIETRDVFRLTDAKVGSYRRACQYLSEMDQNEQRTMALVSREKDYYDEFEPPILRDKTALKPLEIICGDHHQFDVLVIWPDGNIVRPWISAWVDVRTNYWLSFTICRTPDSKSIADSLYNVYVRWGIPLNVLVDNGKSYRAGILRGSKIEIDEIGAIDLPEDARLLTDMLQQGLYGVTHERNAAPYNSRAKVIERMFGTGGFSDWAKQLPGYTGRRYDQMPDDTKKRMKTRNLLSLEDFIIQLMQHIRESNERPSRGHAMGGNSPIDVMRWYWNMGWRPKQAPDKRILDMMAMHTVERTVHRFGIQHGGSKNEPMYYWADELARHVKHTVIVKWAQSEIAVRRVFATNERGYEERVVPARINVYAKTGKFICEAYPLVRAEYLDDPNTAERIKKQRSFRKEVREEIDAMDAYRKYVSITGGTPPNQQLESGPQQIENEPKPLRLVKVDGGVGAIAKEVQKRRKERSYLDRLHNHTEAPPAPDTQSPNDIMEL